MTIVDKLHSVFSSAKTNDVFAKIQKENEVHVHTVPERPETRWSSVFFVLDILCSRYQVILLTLVKRGNDTDDPAVTCVGLYHKMASGIEHFSLMTVASSTVDERDASDFNCSRSFLVISISCTAELRSK